MVFLIEILLFLISFDFLGRGSRIQLLLLGLTLIDIVQKRKVVVNIKTALIYLYIISYAITALFKGFLSLTFISTNLACPFIMNYWGKEIFNRTSFSENQLRKECYIVYSGFFLMGLIALLYSISRGLSSRMEVYSLWGGLRTHNTGIQQTAYFILPESLIVYHIIFVKNKIAKLIGLLAGVASIINCLFFASRSGLYIAVIANIAALLVLASQGTAKKRFGIVLGVIIAATIISLMYINNSFGVADFWQNSNLYERIYVTQSGIDTQSRPEKWFMGLQELMKEPFGSDYQYAHNFWIDVALQGGIVTGVILVTYSIISVKDVFYFSFRAKDISSKSKMFVFALYGGVILAFMVEPMMQSLPLLVGTLFFLDAAIREYNIRYLGGL